MSVSAGGCFGMQERVDDRSFGRVDGRVEEVVQLLVRHELCGIARVRVAGGEAEHEVAARVFAGAAGAADAESGALRDTVALMREQRRVGRDDHDDRARSFRSAGQRDLIQAGAGNDTIDAADGSQDTIDCGDGEDTVIVDPQEDGVFNCETVSP